MKFDLGDLKPLLQLLTDIEEWEGKVRQRPLPDSDPVVHALSTVRVQLERALDDARNIELELSADQYAQLRGISRDALYKRWQRGQLPEARMKGGKLVVPLQEAARVA